MSCPIFVDLLAVVNKAGRRRFNCQTIKERKLENVEVCKFILLMLRAQSSFKALNFLKHSLDLLLDLCRSFLAPTPSSKFTIFVDNVLLKVPFAK